MTDDVQTDSQWLKLAQDAYRSSTDYYDSSLRKQWEKNLSMFRSKHPSGSKYHSDAYRYRSKVFRPKTRSAITRAEASAAEAFFSTADVAHVGAENQKDPAQLASAAINGELLAYRLETAIPWFLTCMGAFQDAMTVGACVSKQYWLFESEQEVIKAPIRDPDGNPVMDEDGQPMMIESVREQVISDKPQIDLLPIENVRFDPSADWRDPVNSSPYWIQLTPMFLCDVKARMNRNDPKTGQPEWFPVDDGTLTSAAKQQHDSVRQERQGKDRQDSHDADRPSEYSIVWVHENFVRKDGKEWVYFTLGTEHLLTEPKPLKEVYFTGKRPFAMGYTILEAHRLPPSGLPEIIEGLQVEANDVANQRLDNVKLTLNTRYFVERTGNVDYRALTRSVPGGVVLTDRMGAVQADRPGDVTAGSYQEQDRLNVDIDEISGTFSPGSVASNRQLGETVGGMGMLTQDANTITAYRLRVFAETWMQPVLRQLVMLEQQYETDQVVLAIAGERANMRQKFGVDEVTDELLRQELTTTVNVGFGSTNPHQRVERLLLGMQALAQVTQIPGVNQEEARTEIFGALGYKDGSRFFDQGEDQIPPEVQQHIQQLEQALQQATQDAQGKEMDAQSRVQVAQIREEGRIAAENMRLQSRMQIDQAKLELEQRKLQLKEVELQIKAGQLEEKGAIDMERLLNEREALLAQITFKEREFQDRQRAATEGLGGFGQFGRENAMSHVKMNDQYALLPGAVG